MKTNKNNLLKYFLTCLVLSFMISCNKEEMPTIPPDENNQLETKEGFTEDELDRYMGDIGVIFSARNIARKGYDPHRIEVLVDAGSGKFDKTLTLNEATKMDQICLAIEELSDAEVDKLSNGVNITTKVYDKANKLIMSDAEVRSFKSNPPVIDIFDGDLEDVNELYLAPKTPYFLQLVDSDGNPHRENGQLTHRSINHYPDFNNYRQILTWGSNHEFNPDTETRAIFEFRRIPWVENGYLIASVKPDQNRTYLLGLHEGPYKGSTAQTQDAIYFSFYQAMNDSYMNPDKYTDSDLQNINGLSRHIFQIKQAAPGAYKLFSYQLDRELKVDLGNGFSITHGNREIRFRPISTEIEWEAENIATTYLPPVLPPVATDFNYNASLINCGSGPLTSTPSYSDMKTVTTTAGWSENVSIASQHSAEVGFKVGVEVEGKFFGNGAKYTGEFNGSTSMTTSHTRDSERWGDLMEERSETITFSTEIVVPPKKAVKVYDAIQVYRDVKVQYVQRIRLTARNRNNNERLSGEELSSMLHFSKFGGIITKKGQEFIEVSVRGVVTIPEFYEQNSEVQEFDPQCDG